MTQFEDAWHLVEHCEKELVRLREMHAHCLIERCIPPAFLIDVKNLMENLRSALDYCAVALFSAYGRPQSRTPKIYFPYARHDSDKRTFRKTVERSIPGLLASRPDIVDRLETYQHFGNTGDWLSTLAELTNENKHLRLTPQVVKQYTAVVISGTVPQGGTVEIDLKRIPLGGGPGHPFHAVAGVWTGLEFDGSGILVMLLLEQAVPQVRRVVEELAGL